MKKLLLSLLGIIAIVLSVTVTVKIANKYYTEKINNIYYDQMGDDLIDEKNRGIQLQKKSLQLADNLLIYGSSELSTNSIPTNPGNFFKHKANGFQINLVGKGYCQDITHAINFGALSNELKGKKVVFIISPQWFTKNGIEEKQFLMNFSELQFYSFMNNKNIKDDLKLEMVNRVKPFLKSTEETYLYAQLYLGNSVFHKIAFNILHPYFQFKYYVLETKEKRTTYLQLNKYSLCKPVGDKKLVSFNWQEELKKAEKVGKSKVSNNKYYICDEYYDKYIKEQYNNCRDSNKGELSIDSPEYKDLELLLKLCKSQGINPLFVSVPVNGRWYDYTGFEKSERTAYYNKINNLLALYGFKVVDLSDKEYEPYLLCDVMHLGWKGWLYIDKEISRYFNEN